MIFQIKTDALCNELTVFLHHYSNYRVMSVLRAIVMPTLANMSRVALRALRGEGPAQRLRHGKSQPPLLLFMVENKNIATRWLGGMDDSDNKKEVEARVKVTPRTPIGRLMGFKNGLCTFIRRWKCFNRSVVPCQLSLYWQPTQHCILGCRVIIS